MRATSTMWILGAIVATTAGCVTEPGADVEPDDGAIADDAVFTETALTLGADGTEQVVTRSITAGEERRQAAARQRGLDSGRAEKIAQDPSCATASFWLFDRPTFVGNKICFSGEYGGIDLTQYHRMVCSPSGYCFRVDWTLTRGSTWSGDYYGRLESPNRNDPYHVDQIFDVQQLANFDLSPDRLGMIEFYGHMP